MIWGVDWLLFVVSFVVCVALATYSYRLGFRRGLDAANRRIDTVIWPSDQRRMAIEAATPSARWEARMSSDGVNYGAGASALTVQPGLSMRVTVARLAQLANGETVPLEELLIANVRGDSAAFAQDLETAMEAARKSAVQLNSEAIGF